VSIVLERMCLGDSRTNIGLTSALFDGDGSVAALMRAVSDAGVAAEDRSGW
jgi:hypothetical protein